MPSLAEFADVVIGVDTHVDTHTAAVVDARTGAVLQELTVATTPAGYQELVDLAQAHSPARVWAIEGTGSHGAGLTRYLRRGSEVIVELDRPERATRRHGAKSDPLDAARAAREAMARPVLGTPREGDGDRQALSVLLAARRSAVDAARVAQQQLFSLVIAAPEVLRDKFRQLNGVATPFLLDDGTVSQAYGTLGKGMHAGLPGHSFVLIDKAGEQRWYGEYPSMWLSPDQLITELRTRLAT